MASKKLRTVINDNDPPFTTDLALLPDVTPADMKRNGELITMAILKVAPEWSNNSGGLDCLMMMAKILELGHLQVDRNERPPCKTCVLGAKFANSRLDGATGLEFANKLRNELVETYRKEFNVQPGNYVSFSRIWARIGLDFHQVSFTLNLFEACVACPWINISTTTRLCILDISTKLRESLAITPLRDLISIYFYIYNEPPRIYANYRSTNTLYTAFIIPDRLPPRLILSELYSPLRVNLRYLIYIRAFKKG